MKKTKHTGHVVPYQQNDVFYAKRAQRHVERGELVEALACYRKLQAREEDNVAVQLELAWLYAQLRYYDRSNELLLLLLPRLDENAECYFALGSNFYALGDFGRAEDFLTNYLHMDPDGTYAEEAEYLLDAMDEAAEAEEGSHLELAALRQQFRDRVKELAKEKKLPQQVIAPLQDENLMENGDLVTAYLQVAVAYFLCGDVNKAIEVAREIQASHPDDIAVICNLALFYLRNHQNEEAQALLEKIQRYPCQNDEESFKIAALLCEFGLHQQAEQRLLELMDSGLDAPRLLQYYALASFNAGHRKQALATWKRMTRIDPDDLVADYYYRLTASCLRGETNVDFLHYTLQFPVQEVLARVRQINDRVAKAGEHMAELWEDEDFRKLLLWGMRLQDPETQRAMLHLIYTIAGEKAVPVFKRFLVSRTESDETKQEVMGLLKQMGVPDPYVALTKDGLVEVWVHVKEAAGLSPKQAEVLEGTIAAMHSRYSGYQERLTKLWMRLTHGEAAVTENMRSLEAWQAALEYRYASEYEVSPITIAKVAEIYGVKPSAVSACLQKIYEKDSEDKKHGPAYY